MPHLKNKKGGYKPPTSEDLFGVNDLSNEEKLKDWGRRRRRFVKYYKNTQRTQKTSDN